jgi:hypothetical protein
LVTIDKVTDRENELSYLGRKIMMERGKEYAVDDEDTLNNFRRAAAAFWKCTGPNNTCTAADVARMQKCLKVIRMVTYKEDTVIDDRNYGVYYDVLTRNKE